MKVLWFCLLLLGSSYALAVDTCDYADEKEESNTGVFSIDNYFDTSRPLNEFETWKVKLDQYLTLHSDVNINVIGLAGLSEPYLERIDEKTGKPLLSQKEKLSIINRLLESDDGSYMSLIVAQNVCDDKNLAFKCPSKRIQEKILELAPDNLVVYLHDLERAFNDEDLEMVGAILERMSQTRYAQVLMRYEESFKSILSSYMSENPMPANPDDDWINEYEDELNGIDLYAFKYQSLLVNYAMLSTLYMPAFRPVMIACEQYQNDEKSCIKIAKILVDRSDSNLLISLGYGLMEKVYGNNNNEKELALVNAEKQVFDEYWKCLSNAHGVNDGLDLYIDSNIQDLFINGTHEGKYLEQIALYLYDKHKRLGTEDLIDPESCGLRYVDL